MGYFKSILGIQLAISSLMYDCQTDDRNKASKSDNFTLIVVQNQIYIDNIIFEFMSHNRIKQSTKRFTPYFSLYLCLIFVWHINLFLVFMENTFYQILNWCTIIGINIEYINSFFFLIIEVLWACEKTQLMQILAKLYNISILILINRRLVFSFLKIE